MNKHYLSSLLAVFLLALIAYLGSSIGLQWLFGIVLPYLAVVIFIVGVVRRVLGWSSSAVPFRITTTCGQQKSMPWVKQATIDNPSTGLGVFIRMALEILTFRSLFRNTRMKLKSGPRLSYGLEIFLWVGALAFHYAFLTVSLRHFRFFLEPVPFFVQALENIDSFFRVEVVYDIAKVGLPGVYLSGIVLFAAVTYLFLRRLFVTNVRYISLASDYFPLFLIMGIAFTGILMRYFTKVDITAIKELTMGLVTFHWTIPEGISPLFFIHMFFVSVLLMYFPFSKLMHLGGVFLTPTRNMTGNTREKRHINPWNYPVKVHSYDAYEDDFREKMIDAGLPVEKMPEPQPEDELDGQRPPSISAKGCTATPPTRKVWKPWDFPMHASGIPWTTTGSCRKTGRRSFVRRIQGAAGKIPFLQGLHGHLRALRRLRRQVPLFHRHRRPQEHAGAAGRTAALGVPQRFHQPAKSWAGWRVPGP
jgi:nitrate reductase gamma subunit